MKALIIEDDSFKAAKIDSFLRGQCGALFVDLRTSYTSGLRAIRGWSYDLCIMDMSLPTFDLSPHDEGYETLAYAGDLLLREMERRRISLPTIVVTQFTTFPAQYHEVKTLDELSKELEGKYESNYLGCVFYADEETSWQQEIRSVIESLGDDR